jgi:hypothetical protein
MRGEDYVYPPTTADQVILSDGTRLEKNGKVYADGVRASGVYYFALLSSDWTSNEDGTFSQEVAIEGITSANEGLVDLDTRNLTAADSAFVQKVWSNIDKAETVDGGIVFTCCSAIPSIDIPAKVGVFY